MKKSLLRIKPTSFSTLQRQIAEDPSARLLGVELVINHVNTVMANPQTRKDCRCDPAVGSFWQIRGVEVPLDAQAVLTLQSLFEKAGWPQVQVNYWRGRCTVTLAEHANHQFGPANYDGRPASDVAEAIGGNMTPQQKRKAESLRNVRKFAFAA